MRSGETMTIVLDLQLRQVELCSAMAGSGQVKLIYVGDGQLTLTGIKIHN